MIGYDIFPRPLVTRLQKERRELFDIEQRQALRQVQEQLAHWQKLSGSDISTNEKESTQKIKDLEARRTQLQELSQNYNRPGTHL